MKTQYLPWWGRVIVYAFTGWCIELLFTGLSSLLLSDPKLTGFSYLWMLPVWGFGVYILEYLTDFFDRVDLNIRLRIIVFMLLCFGYEYICGYAIKLIAGVVPWDYTQTTWNVHAMIRLDYAPLWALTGIFLEPYIRLVKSIAIVR